MKQFVLDSFVSKSGGGNKAAVVFDDIGLNENEMIKVSKLNNFSETAFVDVRNSTDNEFIIRYFTPTEEVDICGHAALAAFTVLKHVKQIGTGPVYHLTKAGKLGVQFHDDQILIEMKRAETVMNVSTADIEQMTDLKANNYIADNGHVSVVSSGLPDIILEVKDIEVLKHMSINKEQMINYCSDNKIIGMHVVSRETIEEDSDFCCRNFAPAVGIDEESATGTSNAAMLYYMIEKKKADCNRIYKVEQGYFMNSPSNIYVTADKAGDELVIYVGGKAKILYEQEISI